jgi:biopolymer transport protein ExbB/TolQ
MGLGYVLVILVVLLVTVVKWGLIIWGIVWLVRYLKRSREERQRLRIELGKLAEEVHLIRQELEVGKEQESSTESG